MFVPTSTLAEDVVQETWLAVLNGIDRFEGRSSLKTWIFRILTNTAKTRGERERRSVPFSTLDPEEGGFGPAPKFPRPAVFHFLLRYWSRTGSTTALDMSLFTLRKMAAGGMYDHLGGGFHRYSVDGRWHVPHFEKMLYDQAQLVSIYTEAFQITGDTLFARVVDETLGYLIRDLAAPEGGFYSAEDADSLPAAAASEKKEGAFYVWTDSEINAVLSPDESLVFRRSYGVEKAGNVRADSDPHGELSGQNVLFRQNDTELVAKLTGKTQAEVEKLLMSARDKLFRRRSQRPRPHLDDKSSPPGTVFCFRHWRAPTRFFAIRFICTTRKRPPAFCKTNCTPDVCCEATVGDRAQFLVSQKTTRF